MLAVIPARVRSRNIMHAPHEGGARVAGGDSTANVIGVVGLGVGAYFMLKGAVMTGSLVIGAALLAGAWMQRSRT